MDLNVLHQILFYLASRLLGADLSDTYPQFGKDIANSAFSRTGTTPHTFPLQLCFIILFRLFERLT